MTIWILLTIIFAVLSVIVIVLGVRSEWEYIITGILTITFCILFVVFLVISIVQPISLNKERIRMAKERQQIVYQIENLTESSDKIKLNEWILTYNDWVNDVNTSKETYGWVSWYKDFDMTNHTIINLV